MALAGQAGRRHHRHGRAEISGGHPERHPGRGRHVCLYRQRQGQSHRPYRFLDAAASPRFAEAAASRGAGEESGGRSLGRPEPRWTICSRRLVARSPRCNGGCSSSSPSPMPMRRSPTCSGRLFIILLAGARALHRRRAHPGALDDGADPGRARRRGASGRRQFQP